MLLHNWQQDIEILSSVADTEAYEVYFLLPELLEVREGGRDGGVPSLSLTEVLEISIQIPAYLWLIWCFGASNRHQ